MSPRLYVTNQRRTATKRLALCCGCVGLSMVAIARLGHLQRMQAPEHVLPNHSVHGAPNKIQLKVVATLA